MNVDLIVSGVAFEDQRLVVYIVNHIVMEVGANARDVHVVSIAKLAESNLDVMSVAGHRGAHRRSANPG